MTNGFEKYEKSIELMEKHLESISDDSFFNYYGSLERSGPLVKNFISDVKFDRDRMEEALKSPKKRMPSGLTREEQRAIIREFTIQG